jgi:PAS domain S-box-containing protein
MRHPLLGWDIISEGANRRLSLKNDLDIMRSILGNNDWKSSVSLDTTLVWQNKIIVITDNKLRILHATENMFAMNGYKLHEVIGKSPKMFQGEKTELSERKKIRMAIEQQQSFDTIITNYRKDGEIYVCRIEGFPVFNKAGKLVNFIALESAA